MAIIDAMHLAVVSILLILTIVSDIFLPAEFTVGFLILMYPSFVYMIGNNIGDDQGSHGKVLYFIFITVAFYVLIFSGIYYRYGLIEDGVYRSITIPESIYFSITTWTTLGYGDFAPTPRIRLITSTEAMLGYITMGVWISIVAAFISQRSSTRQSIHEHNREIIKNQFKKNE